EVQLISARLPILFQFGEHLEALFAGVAAKGDAVDIDIVETGRTHAQRYHRIQRVPEYGNDGDEYNHADDAAAGVFAAAPASVALRPAQRGAKAAGHGHARPAPLRGRLRGGQRWPGPAPVAAAAGAAAARGWRCVLSARVGRAAWLLAA